MKPFLAALTAVVALTTSSVASAQAIVYESLSPVVTTAPVVTSTPVVVQSPVVVEAWQPAVANYGYNPPVSSPGFTDYTSNYGNYSAAISYYAPAATYAPVTAYSPVVTSYSPVVTSAYSPVVTTAYSPVVTTAYSPVVSYYAPLYARPRYYVPGQPVRNFFRGW